MNDDIMINTFLSVEVPEDDGIERAALLQIDLNSHPTGIIQSYGTLHLQAGCQGTEPLQSGWKQIALIWSDQLLANLELSLRNLQGCDGIFYCILPEARIGMAPCC